MSTQSPVSDTDPSREAVTATAPQEFAQKTDRAGLLVTDELDKAIARCKTKVENIARDCKRRNRRFRDNEFDLERDRRYCLHGLEDVDSDGLDPSDVLRVPQIFDDPQFFIDGPSSSDVAQGALGDCWFVSALANVSVVPGLIEKICVARDEEVGVYGFIFYKDAGWTDVIIDDLLYTRTSKWEELSDDQQQVFKYDKDLYNVTGRKGTKTLYFASSATENETWVPLIEKAYAKLFGDYKALKSGYAAFGIEDLTGGVAYSIHTADILSPGKFWEDELLHANEDRLFGCVINLKGPTENGNSVKGLLTAHAYTVIRAIEVKGKRFVKVRNPWAKTEWTGRWSDGSREWTTEWLAALPELKHTFGDDGEFLMEYSEFLSTFNEVNRTRLFDTSWVLSSQWLNVSAQPLPSWNFGDVSFTVSVPTATPAIFVLGQVETRGYQDLARPYTWSLEFVVYRKNEAEPLTSCSDSLPWVRSTTAEVDLAAGEYVVHVKLDRLLTKTKDFLVEKIPTWDGRKMARKQTQQVLSESIASNFSRSSDLADSLPIPPETFAGHDLTELELESFAIRAKEVTTAPQPPPSVPEDAVVNPDDTPTQEGNADNDAGDKPTTDDKPSDRETGTKPDEGDPKDSVRPDISKKEEDGPKDGVAPSIPQKEEVEHRGICDICRMNPIRGPLYKCLESDCQDFDMCQKCMDSGTHPASHRTLRFDTPKDVEKVALHYGQDPDPANNIVLGLKVYTNRSAPANIKGQLRHGKVLKWEKKKEGKSTDA